MYVAYYQCHEESADTDTVKFNIFTTREKAQEQLAVWDAWYREPGRTERVDNRWGDVWEVHLDQMETVVMLRALEGDDQWDDEIREPIEP